MRLKELLMQWFPARHRDVSPSAEKRELLHKLDDTQARVERLETIWMTQVAYERVRGNAEHER